MIFFAPVIVKYMKNRRGMRFLTCFGHHSRVFFSNFSYLAWHTF